MQLINVARGGTLDQDLAAEAGHRPAPGTFGSHPVRLAPGSQLTSILQPDGGRTGSRWTCRPPITRASPGSATACAPVAWAQDGLIEAVELRPGPGQHPFMLAVQWHPEAGQDRRLVSALVAAAADGRGPGPRPGGRLRIAAYRRCRASTLASVNTSPAVEVHDLVKRYGRITAVDRLSLSAGRGAVTAVLGPNGAGKTSTVEICEGYRRPDAGTVSVLGLDPMADARRLRPRVGVMLQSGGIPPAVRPGEYLRVDGELSTPTPSIRPTCSAGSGWPGRPGRRSSACPAASSSGSRSPPPSSAPGAGLPRRAHGRPGPAGPPRHLGPDHRAARLGGERDPHHAPHGRGGTPRGLGRHRRSWAPGRRGDPGRPDRYRGPAAVPGRARPRHRRAAGLRWRRAPPPRSPRPATTWSRSRTGWTRSWSRP
jgi:hypothetical protein